MKQWEYYTATIENANVNGGRLKMEELTNMLNTCGVHGWELVSTTSEQVNSGTLLIVTLFFKREMITAG